MRKHFKRNKYKCSTTSQRFVGTVGRILVSAEKQRNISQIEFWLDLIKLNTKFIAILIRFTFFIFISSIFFFFCLHSSIVLELVFFLLFNISLRSTSYNLIALPLALRIHNIPITITTTIHTQFQSSSLRYNCSCTS